MACCIYGMKMFLLRQQLEYDDSKIEQLTRFVQFSCLFYVKAWMTCSLTVQAPGNDLAFLKNVMRYRDQVDSAVGQAALIVLGRHTWYLSGELVVLSLFSATSHRLVRTALAKRLLSMSQPEAFQLGKPSLPEIPNTAPALQKITLSSLVSPASWVIFRLLDVTDLSWLKMPVNRWEENDSYRRMETVARSMLCTNDAAERGVALISDYAGILTKNDAQRQNILQVVEDHRKKYPEVKKSDLLC